MTSKTCNNFHLDCAYTIKKFKNHHKVKNELLRYLNTAECKLVQDPICETKISKTDWYDASNFQRDWVKYFIPHLIDDVLDMYKNLGYDGYSINEIWFQQYNKGDSHGWHTHSANFTNVYYLQLPKSAPQTKIIHPYGQNKIEKINVHEGDILIFPSFVVHKAPLIYQDDQKTIISFNVNATISDEYYENIVKD